MAAQETLLIRYEELRRRVEALPTEVNGWRDRSSGQLDLNAHFSQLGALEVLMSGYIERQRSLLDDLKLLTVIEEFMVKAFELTNVIIKSQGVWDYFRDMLELRFSPTFKHVLWIADTVAWDCYLPVLERAADEGIIPRSKLREPPLTYLTAALSPATFPRAGRTFESVDPNQGTVRLPIPVIEIPWDQVENVWELASIPHEVGHDVEADLQLRPLFKLNLDTILLGEGVPQERVDTWKNWVGEVFADLVALQLAGPAFTETLFQLLLWPGKMVTTLDQTAKHPTPYLRILLNVSYIETLVPGAPALIDQAKDIKARWVGIYGEQPHLNDFVKDFPFVFRALMDTQLHALKNKTVRQLIPYSIGDDKRIRDAARYLLTGEDAPAAMSLKPRQCISAARLAFTQASRGLEEAIPKDEVDPGKRLHLAREELTKRLQKINKETPVLVTENTPGGLRAGNDSTGHKKYIASFVDTI